MKLGKMKCQECGRSCERLHNTQKYCVKCARVVHKEQQRLWAATHRQERNEAQRKRRAENSESERRRRRERYSSNPESGRDQSRKWRRSNPDKVKEINRKQYKKRKEIIYWAKLLIQQEGIEL